MLTIVCKLKGQFHREKQHHSNDWK